MKVRWHRTLPIALAAFGAVVMSDRAEAVPCSPSDVSLTIGGTVYNPTSCADDVSTDGTAKVKTSSLNSALGTSGFRYLDKSNDDTPTGKKGVSFQVLDSGGNRGTWSLTWAELPGSPNVPLVIDLEVGLFGGGNGAGYLFEDVLLPAGTTTAEGTFDINFTNSNGRQPRLRNLILAGDMATATPAVAVPEPSTLALFGSALLGFGWLVRRRRRV